MKKALILLGFLAVLSGCDDYNVKVKDGKTTYRYTVIEAPALAYPVTVKGTYLENRDFYLERCGARFIDINGIQYFCVHGLATRVIALDQALPVTLHPDKDCGC